MSQILKSSIEQAQYNPLHSLEEWEEDLLNRYTATNPETKPATNTSAETKIATGNSKLRSVAFTVGDLSNPFFVLMGQATEAEAKKIGGNNVNVTVVSSAYDLNQQSNQIENFTASNTDIIIVNAADKSGIKPAIEKAKLAGRIVIAVDTGAEGGVDATITTNNVQAGEVSCKYIADRLKGKGNVVIVNGLPVDSVIQRVSGCESVLSKYPDIKILSKNQNAEGSRDGGLRVMTDLLTTFPKIDAVFAINDPSGVGAELAANQAQRKDFFIVGVDGAPEAITAIAEKLENFQFQKACKTYTVKILPINLPELCQKIQKSVTIFAKIYSTISQNSLGKNQHE